MTLSQLIGKALKDTSSTGRILLTIWSEVNYFGLAVHFFYERRFDKRGSPNNSRVENAC